MGGKEKVHQGTCIKDTWTKPKGTGSRVGDKDGWGGGLWWGENGDNCIWTTNKKTTKEIT